MLEAHLDRNHRPDAAGELARAAVIGPLGPTGATNVQGDKVRTLDVWATDVVITALDATGRTCTLYEASPMAMLVEQAGGAASTGRARVPTGPHQRVPLSIGSPEGVQLAEQFYAARRA
jgi:fructose-1,6-bisphosphatase